MTIEMILNHDLFKPCLNRPQSTFRFYCPSPFLFTYCTIAQSEFIVEVDYKAQQISCIVVFNSCAVYKVRGH